MSNETKDFQMLKMSNETKDSQLLEIRQKLAPIVYIQTAYYSRTKFNTNRRVEVILLFEESSSTFT